MSCIMMSILDIPDPQRCPKISDFNVICRICLKSGITQMQLISAYVDKVNSDKEVDLCEKIRMCSDIEICEGDDVLPNNICDKCVNLVLVAHYFRVLSATSDRILRSVLVSRQEGAQGQEKRETVIKMEWEREEDWDNNYTDEEDRVDCGSSFNIGTDSFNKKIYVCDICQFKFSDKSSLSDHLASHNDVSRIELKAFKGEENISLVEHNISDGTVIVKNNKLLSSENKEANLSECKNENIVTLIIKKDSKNEIKQEIVNTEQPKQEQEKESSGYFECLICNTSFECKEELSRHMYSHDKCGKYKCYGCEAVFDKYSERTHHEKYYCPKMPPGTKYECSKCKMKCDNRFRFDSHLKFGCVYKPVRPEVKTIELYPLLKCEHCELTTMSKGTLKNHILNCHTAEKPYICEICGKGYAMVSSLNSHRKQSHATEKKYKCLYCPYAARQQSSLNVHTRRHTLEYRYSCEICGASFKQNTGYHIHMRRYHREKEHQCEMCKKMFSEKAAMKQHVSSVHLGLKPHECKVCGAAYSRKRSLKAHLLRAHNIVMANNALYEKVVHVTTTGTSDQIPDYS